MPALFLFFIPLLVSFCFSVPKSNYGMTNFYFFNSLGLCGRRRRSSVRSLYFILFIFLTNSFNYKLKQPIHPSLFSTIWIFNPSGFALTLSYLMCEGGPKNLPGSSGCVGSLPPRSHPPTRASATVVTFRCGSLTEQTRSGETLS